MPEPIIRWLETAPWTVLLLAFLVENVGILALVVCGGDWLIARYGSRRVAQAPEPLSSLEVGAAAANVMLNTLTTLAGLFLWRSGIVRFRDDVGLVALLDVLVLLLSMDLLMYLLHRLAHTRLLYPILHRFHHRYDRPRPLTLFVLSPIENIAFGALWLAVISVYDASWMGMSIYLVLNVAFGMVGHLGVEPLSTKWVRMPVLKYLAGSSFHAQHHQDRTHNFGFYTLIWDHLFGTVQTEYEESFGRIPDWIGDVRNME